MTAPVPFQQHSETSLQAALDFAPISENMENRVYRYIQESGAQGCTDAELIAHFGTQSARPRRIALEDKGRVRDSGQRRKTPAGRKAVVWVACG